MHSRPMKCTKRARACQRAVMELCPPQWGRSDHLCRTMALWMVTGLLVGMLAPSCSGLRMPSSFLVQPQTVLSYASVTSHDYARPPFSSHLSHEHRLLLDGHADHEAQQVHINLAGPGQVYVVYATRDYRADSVVSYKETTEADKGWHSAEGTKQTYTQRICAEPFQRIVPMPGPSERMPSLAETMKLQNTSEWLPADSSAYHIVHGEADLAAFCWPYFNNNSYYESPTIHTVLLTGLQPSTTYSYRCGDNPSREFTFKMPPEVGPEVPLRVGVWADVGQSNVSVINARSLQNFRADINLLAGDLTYADGTPWRWDTWGRLMEPLLSENLHLYCPGNHDVASGAEQAVPYNSRMPSPWRSSKSSSPLWYSLDIGPMHLISLAGTYSPIGPGYSQYEWLRDDLAGVDRGTTPWLVVMWHVPWYNSNENHKMEAEPMRHSIERMIVEAGVNLVINGHVHSYERSHPVSGFQLDECGPTHIVVGDGGNYEGPALPWKNEQPAWSAFREASFGTAQLEIQSSQRAVWRWTRHVCAVRKHGMHNVWTGVEDAVYWVEAGDAESACATESDNSSTSHTTVDEFVLTQHPERCRARSDPQQPQAEDQNTGDVQNF